MPFPAMNTASWRAVSAHRSMELPSTTWWFHELGATTSARLTSQLHRQAYEDTLEWPEPLAGSRAILSLGDHTIVAQLPAAAMLPAPAPPEELTSHAAALQRLPSGGDGRQPILEGAFHEVRSGSCHSINFCCTQ